MGINLGAVEATLKLQDQFSSILTAAGSNLSDFLKKVLDTAAKSKDGNDKLESSYRKLAASLDPVLAGEQKLESAHKTLDAALQKGLVSQDRYNTLLDKAREKYTSTGQASSIFSQLLGKLSSVTGEGGELIAKLTEHVSQLGEKLGKLGEDGGSAASVISPLLGMFAELLPLLLAVAAAAVAVGVGWESFNLIKDAVKEGIGLKITLDQLDNSLAANGSAADKSSKEIMEMATSLAFLSGQSKESILQGLLLETRFTKLGSDIFPRVAEAAVNMSRALPGKSVEEAFSTLSRVMEGDARSLRGLRDAGVVLLPSQKAYLTQLVEQGKILEYQNELMSLLERHLGKAAETYASSLPGAIANTKNAYREMQEGIASNLIPIIEDLATDFIKQVGHSDDLKTAWKNIGKDARDLGDTIGNFLRLTVLGLAVGFVQLELHMDGARIAILQWRKDISTFKIGNTEIGIGEDVTKRIDAIRDSLMKEGAELLKLEDMIAHPKRALTGSDVVPPKVSGDDIAKKAKDASSALEEWDKIVRAFNDHVDDQNRKLVDQIVSTDALVGALGHGLIAYEQENQVQQKNAAIQAELTKADQEFRTEVEKLTDVIKKLHDAHDTKDEKEKIAALKDIQAEYQGTRLAVIGRTAAEFDDKTQLKDKLAVTRETTAADDLYAKLQAEISNVLTHTATATQRVGRELAIKQVADRAAQTTDATGIELAKQRAAADYDRVSASKSLLAIDKEIASIEATTRGVQASVQDWQAQRDATLQYGQAITSILSQFGLLSQATEKRKIEEQILAKQEAGATPEQLADLRKVLEANLAIVTGLHQMQANIAIAELRYKEFADSAAQSVAGFVGNILKTGDAKLSDFLSNLRGGFASVLEGMIKDWLTQWFEAMAAWLMRWIATQATAKAVQAGLGTSSGGFSMGYDPSTGGMSGMPAGSYAGMWGSAGTSGVAGSGSGVSGLFSGTGSFGAVGMVAAWAAALTVFAIAINKLNDHFQKTEENVIALDHTLDITTPVSGSSSRIAALEATGKQLAYQIQQFFITYDGIFTSLDASIGVKRRGRGGNTEWKVYVDGIVTNFGKDMQAALDYAAIEAVKHSSSVGLDPLVIAAIKDYAGKSAQEFKSQVDFAQRLATQNLPGISGQLSSASQQYFSDLHQAQTQFADDLAALGDAVSSIAQKFNDTVNQIKNSALGINTSTADFLAGLVGFQTQMAKTANQVTQQLQKQIDDANARLLAMGAGPAKPKPGTDQSDNAEIAVNWEKQRQALRDQIKKYTDELAAVPKALSDTEVNMAVFDQLYKYLQGSSKYAEQAAEYAKMRVDAEFDLIRLQLIALDKWGQFAGMWTDALHAAEASAEHAATQRPGGTSTSNRAAFDQQLKDIASQGLSPAQKALYDYQKQLHDLAEQQKKDKAPIADYLAALKELDKEFKAGLLATAKGYAGVGMDAFAQKLQDGQKFFADLEKMGRVKSGIPDWLEKVLHGKFLDEMKKDWQSRVDAFRGMANPMDVINASTKQLTDDLMALSVATGMSADQIKTAKDEIAKGAEYQRQNAVNGILDTLFGYLQNDAAYTGQAAALKKQELQIQFTLYEYQLKALNAWTDATAKLFKDAEAAAMAAADASASASTAATAAASINQSNDPWALLKQYTSAALDPLTAQLDKINTDFAFIRLYLGNTAEVWQAETNAIKKAFQQAENGLESFYNSLNTGTASAGTIDQQFHAAQQTYEATLAEVQVGNYTHLGDLNSEAQALIGLAGQEYGTSTGGFQGLRTDILAELQPILALAGVTAGPITGTGPSIISVGLDSMISSTNNVSSAIQSASARQESLLTQILASLQAGAANINANGAWWPTSPNRVQSYGRN
jgi:uncharacterized protein YukE